MYFGNDKAEVEAECDLGATSNVVFRLTENVPSNAGYKLFFDNFYTALPVLVALQFKGINCLGKVRRNRTVNSPITPQIQVKKNNVDL